jgi:hypothetical protein
MPAPPLSEVARPGASLVNAPAPFDLIIRDRKSVTPSMGFYTSEVANTRGRAPRGVP